MTYASEQQWADRYGHLDDHLTAGQVAMFLAEASDFMDDFMGRRPLYPRTVTGARWEHRGRNHDRIMLPDYPPHAAYPWLCRLTALAVYDGDGTVRHTIADPDVACTKWVDQTGTVLLPADVTVHPGDIVEASYLCGYGTIAAKPSNTMTAAIPPVLRAAALEMCKSLVLTALGQRGEFELLSEAGIAKSKAQEMLVPWRRLAVTGGGA